MGQVSLYRLWRACVLRAFPDYITWPHACHNFIILLAYLGPQILQVLVCRSHESSNGRTSKLFISHTCGRQKRGARTTQRLPSRDISAQAYHELSEIAPAQLFHATTHACSWKAWVPRLTLSHVFLSTPNLKFVRHTRIYRERVSGRGGATHA